MVARLSGETDAQGGQRRRHWIGALRWCEAALDEVAVTLGLEGAGEVDDQTRGVIADRATQKFAPESFQVREAARQAREMIKSAGAGFAKSWTEALAPLGPGESEQRAAVDALSGKGAA